MIYDCFPFFNEVELLEIRLNVLKDVVDKFIILEAHSTHSGKAKPLYLDEHHDLVRDFPIQRYNCRFPDTWTSWQRERMQRDWLINCIDDFKKQDRLIVSDLDEIPDPNIVAEGAVCRVVNDLYYFYLNASAEQKWPRSTYIIGAKEVLNMPSLTDLRMGQLFNSREGGWHFSSLGGKDRVIQKLESFAHTEFDNVESKSTVVQYLEAQKSIHGEPLTIVPIDDRYPDYIKDNWEEKYPHLVWSST